MGGILSIRSQILDGKVSGALDHIQMLYLSICIVFIIGFNAWEIIIILGAYWGFSFKKRSGPFFWAFIVGTRRVAE